MREGAQRRIVVCIAARRDLSASAAIRRNPLVDEVARKIVAGDLVRLEELRKSSSAVCNGWTNAVSARWRAVLSAFPSAASPADRRLAASAPAPGAAAGEPVERIHRGVDRGDGFRIGRRLCSSSRIERGIQRLSRGLDQRQLFLLVVRNECRERRHPRHLRERPVWPQPHRPTGNDGSKAAILLAPPFPLSFRARI